MSAAIEVVVARHREDVAWTRNVPPGVRVTIYDKGGGLEAGGAAAAEIVPLANVGREAHTYLHHIVERYAGLAELTFFCQGRPFDHAHDLHHVLRAAAAAEAAPAAGFRWLGFIIDTDDPRGRRLFVPWSKNEDGRELQVDVFHEALWGAPPPPHLRFYPGAQFAVTAAQVHRRPRVFYERALGLSTTFPDAAHCFERLWDRVFDAEGVDPGLLGGADCVYLKPIRRLRDSR